MQEIDQRDRDVLNALQAEVPLVSTPFAVLGQQIDMSEKEVIKRTERLKREGLLRQISATFDPRALGYRSCLVAARVEPGRIDTAAAVVSAHPGVSQNYRRNHDFNLWFTIAVSPQSRLGLEKTVEVLGEEAECQAIRLLPTLKLFKNSSESGDHGQDSPEPASGSSPAIELSEREIEVIRLLQKDLPLQPRPFEAWGKTINLSGDEILDTTRDFIRRQLLRKYSGIAQKKKPSISATAMGVWVVPDGKIEDFGAQMLKHREVSHCYLRPVYEDWPYNVFTTVHGKTVDECDGVLQTISSQTGVQEMRALYPTQEFKRTRVLYFSPSDEVWESTRLQVAAKSAVS